MNTLPNYITQTFPVVSLGSLLEVVILSTTAIILGLVLAKVHTANNKSNKGFTMTLAILPLTIQIIIFLVNGNVGTGVAVMGAFGLVRFRSMPGTAKEIGSIFASMAIGLALGIEQILIAVLFTVIYSIVVIAYEKSGFGGEDRKNAYQLLKITIPEDLYVPDVFTAILDKYTTSYELERVKTSNMGTLFKLEYKISFNEDRNLKQFLNELRCRNGNLDINYNLVVTENSGL